MTKEQPKGSKSVLKWEKNVHKFKLEIDYFL